MSEKKELNQEQLEKVSGGDNATPKGWEDNLNFPIENATNDPNGTEIRCPEEKL